MSGNLVRQATVIIAALLLPILPFVIIGELPGDEWLSARDNDASLFALTGTTLLALDIFIPVPSSILGTLMAARLGFWPGFACIFAGLVVGNLVGFGITRLAVRRFRSWLPQFPKTTSLAVVFLTRPIPIVAEAMALAAGATRMPVPTFLLVSGSGNLIYAFALAANGAALVTESFLTGRGLILPMLLPAATWLAWRAWTKKNA